MDCIDQLSCKFATSPTLPARPLVTSKRKKVQHDRSRSGTRSDSQGVRAKSVEAALAGFLALLPISMSSVGTSMETYVRLMIFKSWI
jgi:hypothetical protein